MVQEDLDAIRVVKSFVREDREKEKFFQRSETLRQTAERARASLCAHVQRVLEQLGEQDSRELIRLLGRITEIEASA